jgi:hypothetical protein
MVNMKISNVYIAKKACIVFKKRFFFKRRFRLAEPLNFFSGNLWKVLPEKKRRGAYDFLNRLVDKILWL